MSLEDCYQWGHPPENTWYLYKDNKTTGNCTHCKQQWDFKADEQELFALRDYVKKMELIIEEFALVPKQQYTGESVAKALQWRLKGI